MINKFGALQSSANSGCYHSTVVDYGSAGSAGNAGSAGRDLYVLW